ncbi:hypothetical protein SUSAZ_10205 [Sulfolobus acidocaldarius SUSAZ]|nr:hypothetical protein SUSAZ_10205 [Sulfolobus acidocaldarius SUSAZ]
MKIGIDVHELTNYALKLLMSMDLSFQGIKTWEAKNDLEYVVSWLMDVILRYLRG